MALKRFVCVKKGGCRISDLNLNLNENQVFEREEDVVQSSRGIRAAKNSVWIREMSENEYSEVIKSKEKEIETAKPEKQINLSADTSSVEKAKEQK